MKKIRDLVIFGLSLLALVACDSGDKTSKAESPDELARILKNRDFQSNCLLSDQVLVGKKPAEPYAFVTLALDDKNIPIFMVETFVDENCFEAGSFLGRKSVQESGTRLSILDQNRISLTVMDSSKASNMKTGQVIELRPFTRLNFADFAYDQNPDFQGIPFYDKFSSQFSCDEPPSAPVNALQLVTRVEPSQGRPYQTIRHLTLNSRDGRIYFTYKHVGLPSDSLLRPTGFHQVTNWMVDRDAKLLLLPDLSSSGPLYIGLESGHKNPFMEFLDSKSTLEQFGFVAVDQSTFCP